MKINRQILRGYDVRGVVDQDLNNEIAEHFGRAYGTYVQKNDFKAKKVVIGCDSRLTSEDYKNSLIKGIISTGLDVVDIGLTLSGTVYWAQYYFNTRASVMVTASHNPKEFNGFKFSQDFSESIIFANLEKLADLVESEDYIKAEQPGQAEKININEAYFSDLISRMNITRNSK